MAPAKARSRRCRAAAAPAPVDDEGDRSLTTAVVRREVIECEAVVVREVADEPKGLTLVVDSGVPRGLLLVFAADQRKSIMLMEPYLVARTDEEGLARLLAAYPIARCCVGSGAAVAWLTARLKLGAAPAAKERA